VDQTQQAVTQSAITASLSVSDAGSGYYNATLTVTNSTNATANNWQVAINMNQSTLWQTAPHGGTQGVQNGSVYMMNGLAVFTPGQNGGAISPGSSISVSFQGVKTNSSNWQPTIASVDGIAGSVAPQPSDSIDHISRAAATAAISIAEAYESNKPSNNGDPLYNAYDFLLLDSHAYMLSSDGSQIVFDPSAPGYNFIPTAAVAALAASQTHPSVAAYLTAGLQSCLSDTNSSWVWGFNAPALRGWSYTTTPQNITTNAMSSNFQANGTDQITRVGSVVGSTEQISLSETVTSGWDNYFGLVMTLGYGAYSSTTPSKFTGNQSDPCTPFNGPGGGTSTQGNPYFLIKVNGQTVSARQQLSAQQCSTTSNCTSTALLDPVLYADAGQFYDNSGNLIGPKTNPFSLDPTTSNANPAHQNQYAVDSYGNPGSFYTRIMAGGYVYKWVQCGTTGAGC
jgi:hypothetical protein